MRINPIGSAQTFGARVEITPAAKEKIEETIQNGSKKEVQATIGTLEYLKTYYRIKKAGDIKISMILDDKGQEKMQFKITSPSRIAYRENGDPARMMKKGQKIVQEGEEFIEGRLKAQGEHAATFAIDQYNFDLKKSKDLDEKEEALKRAEEIISDMEKEEK